MTGIGPTPLNTSLIIPEGELKHRQPTGNIFVRLVSVGVLVSVGAIAPFNGPARMYLKIGEFCETCGRRFLALELERAG
jgi:hypothetical protein